MNDRLHIADADLALYALGALTDAEMESARAHLLVCARCKEELRQNTLAVAAYAQTTAEVELPAGARDRFLARLSETAPPAKSVESAVAPSGKGGWFSEWLGTGPWGLALAGALAILLIGVGLDDLQNRAQLRPLLAQAQKGTADSAQLAQLLELLTSSHVQKASLHPGPVTAPPPEGRVVYAPASGKLLLTASNLHPLPAGKTYELWILQPGGKKPLPAGTFSPDSSGNAAMILAQEPAGLAVQGFGVTIENAGGSETPTLPIVLSGF
jgi:anti-sigma-K factor RskA